LVDYIFFFFGIIGGLELARQVPALKWRIRRGRQDGKNTRNFIEIVFE
jgi:hypothetical protein